MLIELRKPPLPGGAFTAVSEGGDVALIPYSVDLDRTFAGSTAVFEAEPTDEGLKLVRRVWEQAPEPLRLPPRVAERPRRP